VRSRPRLRTWGLVGVALTAAGCGGSEEREFTPESFIEEMNANGAALELARALTVNAEGVEVYAVTFSEPAQSATGEGKPPADVGGSATLIVVADAAGAREEFARCEQAPSLTCFRAANAVLRAEELPAAERARITSALESIETVDD